jgi:hypothetical protein
MGDKNEERTDPMRSIHLVAFGIAGFIAATAVVPASATTRQKQCAAPAQSESVDQSIVSAPVAARTSSLPAPTWLNPNACISNEGYGRYPSCDSGTSN